MRIRGERECRECGARWSYYETGDVACPECGSIRSVGRDDRREHTASPVSLDLQPALEAVDVEPIDEVARRAAETTATFVRRYGFIHAGELQPLTPSFVAAMDLRHVGTELHRSLRISDAEEAYLLSLLDGAESGDRPSADAVPDTLHSPYGLAATAAVESYRRDVRRFLAENPDPDARQVLGVVEDHRTRIEALDGTVAPTEADRLVAGTRAIGTYLMDADATLELAREHLAALQPDTL